MAKTKKFKIPEPMFDSKFWNKFGLTAYKEYKKQTFNKSSPKMSDDKPFPSYSPAYKKAKAKGNLKRQDTSYSTSKAPVLTGDLMRDTQLSIEANKNQVSIGWTSHTNKVDHLRKNKRILTDKDNPYPKSILETKLMPQIMKHLNKVMPEGTEVIRMKKKK